MKLLSFIVPVYNAQKWLRDCLMSLLMQDVSPDEYEIICIDDGSSDASAEIITDFQEKYPNVKLFQKENSGVSDSRNLGLEKACGKYIWFVDSDDLVEVNCLGFVKQIIAEHNPEFISLKIKTVPGDFCIDLEKMNCLSYQIDERLKSANNVFASIIRTNIIKDNGIRFLNSLKYGEDTLFQYYVYMYRIGADPSVTVNNVLYYYRQHGSSVMHHQFSGAYDKHVYDLIEMARVYQRDYQNQIVNDPQKMSEIKMRQYMAIEGALSILPRSQLQCGDVLKKLSDEGLYPYPMQWWKVKRAKGMKGKINAFYKLFFKFKLLYMVYYRLCGLV